ncbi:MAG: gamma-glutamylcyclotransferase [Marinibacterium sp.]|nr:gamma-glutamylcyclotransferase [Marinibacterium sp.]
MHPTSPTHLFVYGTLMTSAAHPMGQLLRDKAQRVGLGSIQARLYVIDDPDDPGNNFYPGALPSGRAEDRVWGELYKILDDEDLFEAFDAFEACSPDWPEPHEFLRRNVVVTLEDGAQRWAACYLYSWDVSTARPIASGRYTEIAPHVR